MFLESVNDIWSITDVIVGGIVSVSRECKLYFEVLLVFLVSVNNIWSITDVIVWGIVSVSRECKLYFEVLLVLLLGILLMTINN